MEIDTKCVQGGYRPGNGEPRQVPIYQSTTWKYSTSEDMGKLLRLQDTFIQDFRILQMISLPASFARWKAASLQC